MRDATGERKTLPSGGPTSTMLFVLFAFVFAACFDFSQGVNHLDAVYIEECSPGKYYWKEEDPNQFYACVESTRGINPSIPDYVTNAIRMKCAEGTYMCSLQTDAYFKPCSCKLIHREPDKHLTLSAAGTGTATSSSADSVRRAAKRGSLSGPREKLVEELQNGQDIDTGDEQASAQLDLIGVSTLPPPTRGSRRGRLQQYAKQLSAVSTRTFPSLPANGCPDVYRRYPNAHMFQGVSKPFATLIECQRACTEERNCLGVDWNKLDSPAGSEADTRRCFFVYPESTRYGVQPSTDYCCDHFRRTYCLSTVVPGNDQTVTSSSLLNGDGSTGSQSGFRTTSSSVGQQNQNAEDALKVAAGFLPADTPTSGFGADTISSANIANKDSGTATGYSGEVDLDVNDLLSPGGKIPDTGCPYTFQKFVGRSHPFGRNVTRGTQNNSAEKCKHWCLVRAYCFGVDFSELTSTCYFLREVNSALLVSSARVTHYQKTDCAPPLKCWQTRVRAIGSRADTRVTDIRTPSIDCSGICFVRQTIGTTNVIERGCDATRSGIRSVGCFVDGTPNSNFRTISCYCDTNRCNGLSVEALVSQMLYMPLDGDLRDHSGVGRDGAVAAGKAAPSFTCLDRSVNCSALFMAGQCVTVASLAQVSYTSAEILGNKVSQVPKASFVVHYKRVPTGDLRKQGVFGNSVMASTRPTWAIYADNLTDTSTAGVVTDGTALPNVEDFKYSTAVDNRWHQHVLTYNGKNSPLPTLQYFVDGVEMVGNSRLESGMISVRDQPVALGCVEGFNFVGFIDEARIFSTNLDRLDIDALLAMKDSNFG